LWLVLGLSSFGDWLGLLATSLFAAAQVQGSTAQGAAFGGVIVVRLLPALLLGPVAGVFADRFDRRRTMAFCDLLRFLLFASIPTVALLADSAVIAVTWALVATFLTEMVSMFWIPAKEASVPNLVPKQRLEAANQLNFITTFGVAPVLAALTIAILSRGLLQLVDDDPSRLWIQPLDLALYINAATFLTAAIVVLCFIPQLSGRVADSSGAAPRVPGLLSGLTDGWNFVRRTPMVRGLVYGILGAFAAGGTVIGVGKFYAASLSGGDAAFGLLFGTIFIGLGLGMAAGPALVRELSRRRWFGISIVFAGAAVALLAIAPHLAVAMPLVLCVGVGAGMAYLSGMTLLGLEVADALRGRIFAFVQSMVRVVLMVAIAGASLLVGLGGSRTLEFGSLEVSISAARMLLAAGGALSILTGVLAFRRMDDRPGVPVLADLWGCIRGRPMPIPGSEPGGMFIVFEGGEGAGKSSQAERLVQWLREAGYRPMLTHEPGATQLGGQVRQLLLHASSIPTPRTEALLYAADRAQHVETVIRPALRNGTIVVCDRYIDSSLAYQGGGRGLPQVEVAWLSNWASRTLKPDLVVLLDVEPQLGLSRVADRGESDRIEGQTLAFHRRVRQVLLDRASADSSRYLVVDAAGDPDRIAERIRSKVRAVLHDELSRQLTASAPEEPDTPASDGPLLEALPSGGAAPDEFATNPRP